MNYLDIIAQADGKAFTMTEVAVFAAVFTMINAIIKIGDRLWSKSRDDKRSDEQTPQSLMCGVQHAQLTEAMRAQSSQLEKQSEMLSKLADVIREQVHAEEVRSQGISMRLDLISAGNAELRRDVANLRGG